MASLLAAGRVGMRHAWSSYCDHLARRPLATKILTGVVGTLIGDGIAQGAAHIVASRRASAAARPGVGSGGSAAKSQPPSRFRYDAARAARLCLYSAIVGTPLGHCWFAWLDKTIVLPARVGHPAVAAALAKMALDQSLMAPAGLALFYTCVSLMEGKPWRAALSVARDKLPSTLAANYLLWPAAQLVNFVFVPPSQRILYINVVAVGWVSVLSTMASSPSGGGSDGGDDGGGGRSRRGLPVPGVAIAAEGPPARTLAAATKKSE